MGHGTKALVLLSGGLDSSLALAWAREELDFEITALSIGYGQKHTCELASAATVAEIYGVDHKILHVPDGVLGVGDYVLLKGSKMVPDAPDPNAVVEQTFVEPTFVPGRNMLLLSIAAAHAYALKASAIIMGVSEIDYSGYPDCRMTFIKSMEVAICQALYGQSSGMALITPWLLKSKAEAIKWAELRHLRKATTKSKAWKILQYTHTCYRGLYPPCGVCSACVMRAKGFKEAGFADPLILRATRENL